MRPLLLLTVGSTFAYGFIQCSKPFDETCSDFNTCSRADSGLDADVPTGPVFVSPSGSDSYAGTDRTKPLKTIMAAVAKRPSRISVCAGDYAENVKVGSGVEIVGGFDCTDWSPATKSTKIVPASPGVALEVSNASSPVLVADLTIEAKGAVAPGESSVAVFIANSANVSLTRVKVTAGIGQNGANGTTGSNWEHINPGDPKIAGHSVEAATPMQGGARQTCAGLCKDGNASSGGAGGKGTTEPEAGERGGPEIPENPTGKDPPFNGAGGTAGPFCKSGNPGANAKAAPPAPGANTFGQLTAAGWAPANGGQSPNGGPGQGGGGGGGATRDDAGGGSGGGCGGCGGASGTAGRGGGASIGIAVLNSVLAIATSTIQTAAAGKGGNGAREQDGQAGGYQGGIVSGGGCLGGVGGTGGAGAASGGGAGGVSVGVLWGGTRPSVDDATMGAMTIGTSGSKGTGGIPGGNDGLVGQAIPILQAP